LRTGSVKLIGNNPFDNSADLPREHNIQVLLLRVYILEDQFPNLLPTKHSILTIQEPASRQEIFPAIYALNKL